jgi:hypothetical protein
MDVVQTGLVLYRPPRDTGRPQVGDVARLAGGRLVARVRFEFEDGTRAYACRDYDPSENPETAPLCAAPMDWSREIEAELNRRPGCYRQLEPRDYERERLEFAKFRVEWPFTAKRIAEAIDLEASAAPADLFDLGLTLYPYQDQGTWRRFADRHAAGDFGLYGAFSSAPLADEELWTLAELPIVVGNRAAIAAKSGAIRSRFPVGRTESRSPEKPQLKVVDAVTVLSRGGPRTLLTKSFIDVDA